MFEHNISIDVYKRQGIYKDSSGLFVCRGLGFDNGRDTKWPRPEQFSKPRQSWNCIEISLSFKF